MHIIRFVRRRLCLLPMTLHFILCLILLLYMATPLGFQCRYLVVVMCLVSPLVLCVWCWSFPAEKQSRVMQVLW